MTTPRPHRDRTAPRPPLLAARAVPHAPATERDRPGFTSHVNPSLQSTEPVPATAQSTTGGSAGARWTPDADWTVLLNLNEHLQRTTTTELREAAADEGYELGVDFAAYRP
ncbi:hypothetical protein [Halorubellus litoreus]|uniref:hypothetical protein n=1 Tax=Halorubellus litoreus TaxID=755308 RepID=UPI00300F16D2